MNEQRAAANVDILRKVLLHGCLTRQQISQMVGLSPASVTHYTRWLLEEGFLQSRSLRVPRAKRPVEELSLNPGRGASLAIRLRREDVYAELLHFDSTPWISLKHPVAEQTQAGVLTALSAVVDEAMLEAERMGRSIDVCGLGVFGSVAPEPGIIFSLEGVDAWEPCQPGRILKPLSRIPTLCVWTQVACKLQGYAAEVQVDDQICYVEFLGRHFHIATMRQGRTDYGRYGTSSHYLHQSIMDEGYACYCGRKGCLARYLAEAEIDQTLVGKALLNVLENLEVDEVALEWEGNSEWLEKALRQAGVRKVHHIDQPEEWTIRGLRALTAETALRHVVDNRAVRASA